MSRTPTPTPAPTTAARDESRLRAPRRDNCAWCGSDRFHVRRRSADPMGHAPGTFVVQQCGSCAHTFLNPPLTAEGLRLYGRNQAAGLAPALARALRGPGAGGEPGRTRARAMLPYGEPESWLDVGTGDGSFPAAAKELFPYTAFDGLGSDAAAIEKARAEGRIEEAHLGSLSGASGSLPGRYDTVSMLHHLEHSADPHAELAAARTVLRPGGHLLIEAYDPRSWFGTLLGPWWAPRLQPVRPHLVPYEGLRAELERLGFTVIAADRRGAHRPGDLTGATALLLAGARPRNGTGTGEGRKRLSPPGRAVRRALLAASGPALSLAYALDSLLAPLARHTRLANTYRLVARRG
ncbi:class I SAM-dependent methyltransferase [Streptomyces tsukubensis]|uniref:Class I SAM-dependent methyltransferase n=1 Tax=Streptomyces tsukubensis TaxID=83656 RepID=A0A1V4A754_9ACTN|nr:class I SAM-dependent methyltransferase [Streptomyces tsukubensis]OON77695.1 hypothetical protein B1H18_18420 [Streptomyces tsukubensis]QFR93207.1 methyltransferase domain-containing protein [Streptomyces tsukubensis]